MRLAAARAGTGRWLAGTTAVLLVVSTAMVGTAPPAHAAPVFTTIDQVEYLANDANVSAGASVYRYHAARPWTAPSPTFLSTVTIDDTVYTVVSIAGNAFNCSLTDINLCGSIGDVTIPDTVTTISANAFRRALATSLHLGNSVQTIGANAFADNSLGAVTIPNSVTSFDTGAFRNAGVTSLHLGNSVQIIGQFAFNAGAPNGGTLNNLGAVTIPNSVTAIGNSAFLDAGVTNLVLGSGVTFIGTSAFDGNPALTEIVLTGPAPTTFTDAGATGSFGTAAGKTLYYLPQYGAAAVPGGYTTPTWRGYATFPLQQVTVTFDANGHGTAPAPQTVTEGATATAPTAPTAAGWAFTGWYTDDAATAAYDFATPVTADLTLYAGWAQQFQVTFDANGHGTAPAPATVIDGEQATAPTAPTAVGWVFTGWHTDAAATSLYDFTAPVTGDLTLYAGWEVAQYQVTFDANGHGTAPASETVAHEGVATVPVAPSAAGWSFTGWYTDAAATSLYDFATPVTADLTLYAGWLEQFHVTFDANGHGSAPTAQVVLDGEQATTPTAPTAAGWVFTGWYTDAAATSLYDFADPVAGDLTLYAGWLQEFEVTFDANGHGTAPAAQTVTDGNVAAAPVAPTAAGWVFTGWYTDAATTAAYDFATPITADLTLYAGWVQEFEVTFDANGHGTAPGSQIVLDGEQATAPTAPSAVGWVFTGWYTDAAATSLYDFTTPVAADLTLYAGWEIAQYQVTFDANGHGTAPAPESVTHGSTANLPVAPSAPGWSFTGWYTDAAATSLYDFATPVTGDVTLYADWLQEFQVAFDANGHGTAPTAQVVLAGALAADPGALSAEGWVFTGWYTDAAATSVYDFTTPVTGDLTLYAGWVIAQYDVTFDANGHGTAPAPTTVDHGSTTSVPVAPSATGWTFTGWYTDPAATSLYDFATPVTGDLTLYAGWLEQFEVTFDANGHGLAPCPETVTDGSVATAPGAPSAEGWVFTGWYTDAAATTLYDFTTPVTGGLTLYAGWVIAQYQVTFDANGHGTAPAPATADHGSTTSVPVAPSAVGWTFTGWYTDTAATSPYDFTMPITGDLTLYAGWLEQFEVTFDANGHGTAPAAQTVTDGEQVTTPTAPSAVGWVFTGWYTDAAATSVYDFATPVTGDLTLYAGWLEQFEVTFDANGRGMAPAAQTVTDGDAATVPDAPSAASWTFTGWFTDAAATDLYDFATAVTADLTLYAGWELTPVPPSIHGPATLAATVGVPVDYTPTVGGVVAPTMTLTSGTLPAGLHLDSATGAITGTPQDAAGTYVITITAANGVGSPASLQVTITLDAGQTTTLVAITPSVQHVEQGDTVTIIATGTDSAGNSFVIPAAEMVYRSSVPTDVVDGNRITFPSASPHVITGTHLPTGLVLTTTIEVTPAVVVVAPVPTTTGGSLPATGANLVLLAVIAFVLLIAGVSATAATAPSIARRKQATTS